MRTLDLARGRAVLLLGLRSTSPPDVVVVVRLRTRLVSLRQFVFAEPVVAAVDEATVRLVSVVSRGTLMTLVLLVSLIPLMRLMPLIAGGQGARLRCVVLTLVPVFCAATPGATNAPSATAMAVIRWLVLQSNMLPSDC
jgi:hypothetical protein